MQTKTDRQNISIEPLATYLAGVGRRPGQRSTSELYVGNRQIFGDFRNVVNLRAIFPTGQLKWPF